MLSPYEIFYIVDLISIQSNLYAWQKGKRFTVDIAEEKALRG